LSGEEPPAGIDSWLKRHDSDQGIAFSDAVRAAESVTASAAAGRQSIGNCIFCKLLRLDIFCQPGHLAHPVHCI